MGFLSGLTSLFGGGGGSTEVTTTTTNKTTVDVKNEIANLIDLQAMADAVKAMGDTVGGAIGSVSDQTKTLFTGLLAQMGVQQQTAILTAVVQADQKEKQNALFEKALGYAKLAAILYGVYFVGRKLL